MTMVACSMKLHKSYLRIYVFRVTSRFAEVMFQKRVFASKNVFLPVDPVITIERGSIAFSMQLGKSYSGI